MLTTGRASRCTPVCEERRVDAMRWQRLLVSSQTVMPSCHCCIARLAWESSAHSLAGGSDGNASETEFLHRGRSLSRNHDMTLSIIGQRPKSKALSPRLRNSQNNKIT